MTKKRLKREKKVHFIDQKLLKIVKICLILLKFQRFPQNVSKLAKNSGIGVHFFGYTCEIQIFFFSFWISHFLSEILHVQQGDLIAKKAKIGISFSEK